MLVLLKNYLNYLKDNIFALFLGMFNRWYIVMENVRPEEENINKNTRNLFRLQKETKKLKIE